ncbi:MAG: oligosaccharide flippase family protein [Candidatus Levybacteria bacterium]|nr:oligosaccharide flippase family protein [Candidatus Levybacteria bacterium]
MKKKIKKITSNPLISGSFFIFSGGVVSSLFNFLYNLALSRNLSVNDYGAVVSLISIILLAAIPVSAFMPTIISVSGAFYATKNNAGLKAFYLRLFKPLLVGSFIFCIVALAFINQISIFLHIYDYNVLVLSIVAIVLGYLGTINLGFLQGRLAFKTISFSNSLSSAVKLGLGFFLVLSGFGLVGAMLAFIVSVSIPVAIGYYVLRDMLLTRIDDLPKVSFRELFNYGLPSALVIFSLSSFISTDIILVKHYFPSQQAGLYAGLSLVGKVIFYLTAPISTVMFPTIIHRYNKKESYRGIMVLALMLVFASSTAITIFYYFFPEFTLTFFLKNPEYQKVASLVWLYGIFISAYSLVSTLSYYYLSIKQTKVSFLLILAALFQAGLIAIFHNTFLQVIMVSIIVLSLLLLMLLLYYFINKNNNDNR